MRKKLIHILLLCFVFQVNVKAQSSLPPAYPITNDTAAYTLPNEYWQVLEDKTGKWTLEQVNASPLSNEFHPYQGSINYSFNTHWLRYSLHNRMNSEINIGLYDATNNFFFQNQRTDFFLHYSNGTMKHIAGGWSLPWSEKTGLKDAGFIPFILRPNEEVLIYQRIYNSSFFIPPLSLSVNISSTQKALQQQDQQKEANYFNGLLDAFYYGFLGFAFLFNVLFFFIAKERAHLYFALYTLWIGLARFDVLLDLFREHPFVVNFLVFHVLYGLSAQFFQIHFIRHLINSHKYVPRWNRWLVVLSFLALATHLAYCFLPHTTLQQYKLLIAASFVTYPALNLVAPAAFVAVLYKQHWSDRPLMFAIFPPYFIWGMIFGTNAYYTFLHFFVTIPQTSFEVWLNRWWSVIETFVLGWLVLSFSWVLMRRFIEQRKQIHQLELEKETEKRLLIEQQKELLEQQVIARTADLKQSLENLKATQAQLIQQEKMASLGELTAGIAHEIQNPLNFVNNFSDINNELITEMKEELKNGNYDEVNLIANDIDENETKINHHGKRADAIVKGMLQHSRTSTGHKEPTDINKLADEYLRLSYHGLRAKDKEFNADFKTAFDETIGKINIIPQDIGRVLLNLYNNAFYASSAKALATADSMYKPTVTVTTKKLDHKVEVSVKDNGNGIPQKIVDKIFQPFFTTKPTGQGTGLGLSLAYDIIKAHGGELESGNTGRRRE